MSIQPQLDGSRSTIKDKFQGIKKIVQVEDLQGRIKHSKTERDFNKVKHNKTTCGTSCQNCCPHNLKSNPVIVQKANKKQRSLKHSQSKIETLQLMELKSIKPLLHNKIQRFQPIQIPVLERKSSQFFSVPQPKKGAQEIQIVIQKDPEQKQCLKKLFRKINKLSQQLNESEKDKIRLQSQIHNLKQNEVRNKQLQKKLRESDTDRHRLQLDVVSLSEKLQLEKSKPAVYIDRIVEKPVQVIKQIPIQKIVEVKIEVPKYIPGPERVVEKIVEIPKYIQVQRKVPYQVIKEVIKQIPKQVIKRVEVPEYIQKPLIINKQVPVYNPSIQTENIGLASKVRRLQDQLKGMLADNQSLRVRLNQQKLRKPNEVPVYIDRVIQKPIEVPIEVPVVVDRPIINVQLERHNLILREENSLLVSKMNIMQTQQKQYLQQIQYLKLKNQQLIRNFNILTSYNENKNKQLQKVLESSFQSEKKYQYLAPYHNLQVSSPNESFASAQIRNYSRVRDSVYQRARI